MIHCLRIRIVSTQWLLLHLISTAGLRWQCEYFGGSWVSLRLPWVLLGVCAGAPLGSFACPFLTLAVKERVVPCVGHQFRFSPPLILATPCGGRRRGLRRRGERQVALFHCRLHYKLHCYIAGHITGYVTGCITGYIVTLQVTLEVTLLHCYITGYFMRLL